MCSEGEEEASHVQASVKWADIETGIPPERHGKIPNYKWKTELQSAPECSPECFRVL